MKCGVKMCQRLAEIAEPARAIAYLRVGVVSSGGRASLFRGFALVGLLMGLG
jgi:hypothetical protein